MDEPVKTELCLLAEKYRTDKCPSVGHSYTPFYYELLKDRRDSVKKVFEFGIGGTRGMKHIPGYQIGASLRMWRDFFPNAHVYGADNDPITIFQDERISTFLCDELNEEAVVALIREVGADIDLFIDDAIHRLGAQLKLFRTVRPLLQKSAIYVIEDVTFTRRLSGHIKEDGYDVLFPTLSYASAKANKLMVVTSRD